MMSSAQPDRETTCAVCGAGVEADAPFCWLCRQAIAHLDAAAVAAGDRPVAVVAPRATYQFGLSTLMLMITLSAVLMSVTSMEPGLGLALAVLSAPPVIRTYVIVYRRKTLGRNVSTGEKVAMYLGSLLVTAIMLTVLSVGQNAF
ncbi:hypothetical protein LCGC14_3145490 [marine sediment metagenome]|uniref:Uncharacterized protein n=1 Tax=marine sediment metagenome TaxID=412755 RepID=A0A0F8YK01_9ZZZZ